MAKEKEEKSLWNRFGSSSKPSKELEITKLPKKDNNSKPSLAEQINWGDKFKKGK